MLEEGTRDSYVQDDRHDFRVVLNGSELNFTEKIEFLLPQSAMNIVHFYLEDIAIDIALFIIST